MSGFRLPTSQPASVSVGERERQNLERWTGGESRLARGPGARRQSRDREFAPHDLRRSRFSVFSASLRSNDRAVSGFSPAYPAVSAGPYGLWPGLNRSVAAFPQGAGAPAGLGGDSRRNSRCCEMLPFAHAALRPIRIRCRLASNACAQ